MKEKQNNIENNNSANTSNDENQKKDEQDGGASNSKVDNSSGAAGGEWQVAPNQDHNESHNNSNNEDVNKQAEKINLNPYRNAGDASKEWHRRLDMVEEDVKRDSDDKKDIKPNGQSQQFAFDQETQENKGEQVLAPKETDKDEVVSKDMEIAESDTEEGNNTVENTNNSDYQDNDVEMTEDNTQHDA